MGFDDLVNKGKDLYEQHKEAIDDAVHSERAEGISDSVLGKLSDAADTATSGGHSEKIADVRERADRAVGNE